MRTFTVTFLALWLVTSTAYADHVHVYSRGKNETYDAFTIATNMKTRIGKGPRNVESSDTTYQAKVGVDTFYIDNDLGFKETDIENGFSFGNGVTVGLVPLKDGRRVPCQWVVVQEPCPCQNKPSNWAAMRKAAHNLAD